MTYIILLMEHPLKRQCPSFAVMRKLVFGFRAILRGGKVTTLHRWQLRLIVRGSAQWP